MPNPGEIHHIAMEMPVFKLLSEHAEKIHELTFCRNPCIVETIDDGYMNVVRRIKQRSNHGNSVIVKHAPVSNKLSHIFSDLSFDPNRGHLEYLALFHFNRMCPESVPRPYLFDENSKTLVMEDLRHHTVLRSALMNGNIDTDIIVQVMTNLASWHRQSSDEEEFALMKQTFSRNDTQKEVMKQCIFVKRFRRTDQSNKPSETIRPFLDLVYDDDDIMQATQELREIFMDAKRCLIHSDMHTGSVMVCKKNVKVIDPEFAHMGPSSYDVSTFFAHLLFSYHAHKLYPREGSSRDLYKKIEQGIREGLRKYLEEMRLEAKCQATLLSEIAGFTAVELMRCTIGKPFIEDLEGKPQAEIDCLHAGIRLAKQYKSLCTEEDVLTCMFQESLT